MLGLYGLGGISMYDKEKIVDCFSNSKRWRNEPDEIVAMHMSYKSHALMMGRVVEEFLSVCDARFGAVSVLDVGCGTGMFLNYLKERNSLHRLERYLGYDLVPKFANKAVAKMKENGVRGGIFVEDFFALDDYPRAEFVVASQCLNTIFSECPYRFLEMAIEKLWQSTISTLVFDLKDEKAPKIYEGRTYYDPVAVYSICRKFTQNVSVVQIMSGNFGVTMSREKLF